jgi:uncharacterized protein (DUF433 family)
MGTSKVTKEAGVLGGAPHIVGRRVGVHDVVNLHQRIDSTLDEVCASFRLTPAQVHAALAYYYDHPEEVDAVLNENKRLAAQLSGDAPRSPLQEAIGEMTVAEAAAHFKLTPRAVRSAAERGQVRSRKSGATWLIDRQDAEAAWGHRR